MKKSLFIVCLCLLTSCSILGPFVNSNSSSSSNESTSLNSSSSSKISSQSSSSSISSSNSSKNDLSQFVQNHPINEPDFDTPIRNSKDELEFNDLFNLGNTVSIELKVSDEEMKKLHKDYETGYKTEIYRLADYVKITIENNNVPYIFEYNNVGIRQKGNTSRRPIYNDSYELNNNHYKISFDETFDNEEYYDSNFIQKYGNKEYKDREFLGVSGIDIKWDKNYDETHIREIYSSYFYSAAGIVTPKVGLATFKINAFNKTKDFGLCMIYEKASKSLIKRSFKEESMFNPSWDDEKKGTYGVIDEKYGDLYKCSYGVGEGSSSGANLTLDSISNKKIGVGNTSGSYIPTYERKTNEDVDYDDELLKILIKTLNNKSYKEFEKVIDLDYFTIKEAIGYIVGNPDDMRYNYNNYMIYIRRVDAKAIMIPIDNDRCFGITTDWNVRNGLKNDGVFSARPSNSNDQRNPLLNKTIFADTETKDLYLQYLIYLSSSSWVKNETFDKFYQKAKSSYSNYSFSLGNENGNIPFSIYMSSKLDQIKKYK